jgi:hypothetical protein
LSHRSHLTAKMGVLSHFRHTMSHASLEMQNQAAEIKIRAERRIGEMLEERESAQGQRTDLVTSCDEVPTLTDLGINRMQSSRWQLSASVPSAGSGRCWRRTLI